MRRYIDSMGAGLTLDTGRRDIAARTRIGWLTAWGRSLLSLSGFAAAGAAVAVVWMLVRTDRGRYDLGTGDAVLALSLFAAAAPAWSAWQWLGLRERAQAFEAAGTSSSRRLWLLTAMHPALVPFWLWVTAMLLFSGVALLGIAAVAAFTMFVTGGALMIGSVPVLLMRPSARPLHEWFARASFGGGQ